jgi:hypothetical protein
MLTNWFIMVGKTLCSETPVSGGYIVANTLHTWTQRIFLNIPHHKIIQEYLLNHCFILECAILSSLNCPEYCIAALMSLILKRILSSSV